MRLAEQSLPAVTAKALHRLDALNRFRQLKQDGLTNARAADQVGVNYMNVWRWFRRLQAGGVAALQDRPHTGRPDELAKRGIVITEVMISTIQRLAVAHGASRAWRMYSTTPGAPPALAAWLATRSTIPLRLMRLVRMQRQPAVVYRGRGFQFVVPISSRRSKRCAPRRQPSASAVSFEI